VGFLHGLVQRGRVFGSAGRGRVFPIGSGWRPTTIPIERTGRHVRVQLSQGTQPLAIAEREVLGVL